MLSRHVVFQTMGLSESLGAHLTSVRSLASVSPLVFFQVVAVVEPLATCQTMELLFPVADHVLRQTIGGGVPFVTEFTGIFLQALPLSP